MADYDNAGQHITYVDEHGIERDALVTCWHGSPGAEETCINLVFVTGDEKRVDSSGRQIERRSSIVHESRMSAHGNFWRQPSE